MWSVAVSSGKCSFLKIRECRSEDNATTVLGPAVGIVLNPETDRGAPSERAHGCSVLFTLLLQCVVAVEGGK